MGTYQLLFQYSKYYFQHKLKLLNHLKLEQNCAYSLALVYPHRLCRI